MGEQPTKPGWYNDPDSVQEQQAYWDGSNTHDFPRRAFLPSLVATLLGLVSYLGLQAFAVVALGRDLYLFAVPVWPVSTALLFRAFQRRRKIRFDWRSVLAVVVAGLVASLVGTLMINRDGPEDRSVVDAAYEDSADAITAVLGPQDERIRHASEWHQYEPPIGCQSRRLARWPLLPDQDVQRLFDDVRGLLEDAGFSVWDVRDQEDETQSLIHPAFNQTPRWGYSFFVSAHDHASVVEAAELTNSADYDPYAAPIEEYGWFTLQVRQECG